MKRQIVTGSTSVLLDIFIQDTTSSTGAGLTGLTSGSSGLTCYYHRNTANAAVAVSLTSMTIGTFTSSGFVEVDATNMPGVYQLCLPNAAYNSGAQSVSALLKGAANMAVLPLEIELTAFDMQTAAVTVANILTTQMTESYAADGTAPTLAQFCFQAQQFQQEKAVSGTTMTVKKLDGATTAMTFTLDSATTPTSITRAT